MIKRIFRTLLVLILLLVAAVAAIIFYQPASDLFTQYAPPEVQNHPLVVDGVEQITDLTGLYSPLRGPIVIAAEPPPDDADEPSTRGSADEPSEENDENEEEPVAESANDASEEEADPPAAEPTEEPVEEAEASSDEQETPSTDEGEGETEADSDSAAAVDPNDALQFDSAFEFVSNQDGYQFRNYTTRYPEGKLTIAEAQNMFGDVVCVSGAGETCVPHPKVTAWLDNMNDTMAEVGHCTGFTVSSNQIYSDIIPVTELGASQTFDLPRETQVLRTISQGYASYYASNVWQQEVYGKTPTEIVEALLILDEPVDIGIFYPEYGRNGHSILGHDVVDQGGGVYHIMVYDSNRPGEDNVIVVDTNADSWFYAEAAINPDEPYKNYFGDAETQSLSFIPLSAYNQPLACPADFAELCPAGNTFTVVALIGQGKALVTAVSGQIGQFGERLVNTVTNGRFLSVRGELHSRQHPMMLLNSDETFTVEAEATRADEPLSLSITSPEFSVVVEGLIGQPGQTESLTFDPVSQEATFASTGTQWPTFEMTFNHEGSIYSTQVLDLTFEPGQTLDINFEPETGDLQLSKAGPDDERAIIVVAQISPAGQAIFASPAVPMPAGSTQGLDLDGWDGTGALTILTDADGDGAVDSEAALENTPVGGILAGIDSAEATLDTIQTVEPYFDPAQTESVATTLPTLTIPGSTLGKAYQSMPSTRPADLPGTLTDLNYAPQELGDFLSALNLDDGEQNTLLDGLGLSDEERAAVETAFDEVEAVQDALDDWAFLNLDDGDTLADFVETLPFTDDQVSEFLGQVELPETDLQPIRQTYVTHALADACSLGDAPPVETAITFINTTSAPVTVYWIDFECVEQSWFTLPPGDSRAQGTFTTHPWRARNAAGELIPLGTPGGLVYTFVNGGTGRVTVTVQQ